MSVKVMKMAWYVEGLTPAQKVVLVALADHAGDDGSDAYPAVSRLAKKTSLSERAVRRALKDLRNLGLIKVQQYSAQHQPTKYILDLPEMHPSKTRPARNAPLDLPEMHPSSPPGVPEMHPNHPLINHQLINHPLTELADYFSGITHIPVAKNGHDEPAYFWKEPLEKIIDLVDGDMQLAKRVISETIQYMDNNSLTISSPSSIQKTAIGTIAKMKRKNSTSNQPGGTIT